MTLGVGTEDTRGWEWQQAVGVRWGVARPRVSVRSRGGNLQPERRRQVRILESEHDVSMLGEEEAGLREEGIWGGGGGKGDWAPDVDQSGLGKWAEKEGRARVEAQEWILGALKGDPEVRAWGEGGPGEWPQGWAGDPDPLRRTGAEAAQALCMVLVGSGCAGHCPKSGPWTMVSRLWEMLTWGPGAPSNHLTVLLAGPHLEMLSWEHWSGQWLAPCLLGALGAVPFPQKFGNFSVVVLQCRP